MLRVAIHAHDTLIHSRRHVAHIPGEGAITHLEVAGEESSDGDAQEIDKRNVRRSTLRRGECDASSRRIRMDGYPHRWEMLLPDTGFERQGLQSRLVREIIAVVVQMIDTIGKLLLEGRRQHFRSRDEDALDIVGLWRDGERE